MKTLLALLFSLVLAVHCNAGDWPQYLGPNGDGITNEKISDRPSEVWKRNLGIGISQVVVKGSRAYTMGNFDNETTIYCIDPTTGKDIWTVSFFSPSEKNNFGSGRTPFPGGPTSTPTIEDGRLYTLSRFGHVHCLDAETGKVIWDLEYKKAFPKHTLPTWGYSGSPLVSGGRVYLEPGGKGHSCVALDAKTGAIVWKAGKDDAAYSTPLIAKIDGKRTLLTFNAFGLVGRNPSDGTEFFRERWKTSYDVNAAQPVVLNDINVFVSSGYGSGGALLKVVGGKVDTIWETKKMANKHTVSLLIGKHLYGFSEDTLRCIDVTTGKSVWDKDGYGRGSLTGVGGGKAIVQAENGTLAIAKLSPAGIDVISENKLFKNHHSWTAPSVAGGRIFTRDVAGNVVCLK